MNTTTINEFSNVFLTALSSRIDPVYPRLSFFLLLVGEIAPSWILIRPLLVEVEQDEDGSYIMSDVTFGVYGHGNTVIEAKQDLIITLIDYYELLAERAEQEPLTYIQFRRLRLYLDRVQPQRVIYVGTDRGHFDIMNITKSYVSPSQYYLYAT